MTSNALEFYSCNGAYNFIKRLLKVPENVRINKKFFYKFFIKESENKYVIKKTEEEIEKIFIQEKFADLNQKYYDTKESKQLVKANLIKQQMLESADLLMAT